VAIIRVEARKDPATGLFYLEIYHPATSEQPLVTTEPRYQTAAAAENDFIALIASRADTSPSRALE
jgi:hypothetical protein